MKCLTADDVDELKRRTSAGEPWTEVAPSVLGGTLADDGFWRFFGSPELGLLSLTEWNAPDLWKHAWRGLASLTFWGEDVFGNQILLDGEGKVFLWNHENASAIETGFDLPTVLETCLGHGLGWIDFYSDGSYLLAKDRQIGLPIGSHWHWIQPRIMGGQATATNLTPIERVKHLIAHGQLWLQVRGMSPGDRIILKA